MKLVNDQSCAWIKDLPKRANIKILKENIDCDWLIIERDTQDYRLQEN